MLMGKRVLAVIPARSGSKGLPGKNLRDLKGRPLIAWSIDQALQSSVVDRVVVSTDDSAIAKVATQYGADVPFLRPRDLAGDHSPTRDALVHCVDTLAEQYDYLVLMQPTSPLRTQQTLSACIELSIKYNERVISVSESHKPVEWMFYRKQDGFTYVIDGISSPTRRQDCRPVHYVDGCVYCMPVNMLIEKQNLFDESSLTVVSSPKEAVDIDTLEDFQYCEFLLSGEHLE